MEVNNHFLRGRSYEEAFGKERAQEIKRKIGFRTKGKTYEELYGEEKSKQFKQKLSMGNARYWLGKTQIQKIETNKKRSLALRGKRKSEEHKINIGKSNKGKKPRLGMRNTEQSKSKMRLARSKMIYPIKDTSIEKKIQSFLRELGIEFQAHVYLSQIQHAYQCDLLIPSLNLIIECDGNYWHNYPYGKELDHLRTQELQARGFQVLRLWEHEIKNMNLSEFSTKIGRLA